MLSFILPTRDRPEQLAITLAELGRLDPAASTHIGGAEVIVVDNASRFVPPVPERLANGTPVRLLLRDRNDGAAARNLAARHAAGDWLVMLDDDSHPLGTGFVKAVEQAAPDVAAVAAEIFLESGREAGGLPEVFIGCGVAIRREVFLDAELGSSAFNGAGYDPAFHYYAEEYDLAARMILGGWRVTLDRRLRVMHRKVAAHRDMDTILRRLVRNNAWVEQRYAPEVERRAAIQRVLSRYRSIAEKEGALRGYDAGLADLDDTLDQQPRAPMTTEQYARFTGEAAARTYVPAQLAALGAKRVALIERGKNSEVVERVVREAGVEVVSQQEDSATDALVVATLSPGPMLDALERHRSASGPLVVAAWDVGAAEAAVEGKAWAEAA